MKKQIMRLWMAVCLALACTVSASALPSMLIPGGSTVGVKLYTRGLMVTDVEKKSPAREAGLQKGDLILEVNGEAVHSAAELRDSLLLEQIILTVLRNGKEAEFCVKPQDAQIGAFVQDSIAGIGTVTYYDPNTGAFGALGHGVSSSHSELLLPVEAGVVVRSSVAEVQKGKHGAPGELKGKFDVNAILGNVKSNLPCGIFGTMSVPVAGKPLPVAQAGEIETGTATILSNVSGEDVQAYSVEILKLYPQSDDSGRNIMLQVTDQELLSKTGGIVQGMSGSPIIQDGKLVGAVTHVLVNDPTRGYGIFIENMLDAAG